jgi:hypothetical protein
MLVNKNSKKLHEDIKINSNNIIYIIILLLKVKISWKSAKEWLNENVMKISGFIWNI